MRTVSNYIRLAVITDVDHASGVVRTKWMDQTNEVGPDVPIPHPYAGKGGEGIFVGPREGSIIALDTASSERWIPVFTLPLRAYYSDLSSTDEIDFEDIGFPTLGDGEVVLQGRTGAQLRFDNNGDVLLYNAFGEGKTIGGDDDTAHRCSVEVSTPVEYQVSQAGISARGLVRRDVRIEESDVEFDDFLTNLNAEQILEEVGWDPSRNITHITRTTSSGEEDETPRNPPFVEDRQVIFEYARDWLVDAQAEEEQRFGKDDFVVRSASERRERRSNVLSLSLEHPNEFMEKVSGTLVDVFGNLIDINRNIIPVPKGSGDELLDDIYEKARHTVGFHMEMNSRKGWAYRHDATGTKPSAPIKSGPNVLTSANNTRDRSRWSIDVDKEGLTKINIPASSETGNIPRLTRYETSSVIEVNSDGTVQPRGRADKETAARETALLYRNEKNIDILIDQFGPGGIRIKGDKTENRLKGKKTSWLNTENTQETLPQFIEAGTAFHNITETAKALLEENINNTATGIFENTSANQDPLAVSDEIDPQVSRSATGLVEGQPNAGGRSLHLNLDGSLETSIGANTIDRVSWILDTAGALVARLGRDRQGRSAIIHTDGTIAIEAGGFDYVGEAGTDEVDTRFVGKGQARTDSLPGDPQRFREGKFVFRIRRANPSGTGPDEDDHTIIIDDTGITIKTAGRMNLVSDQKMTLQSKALIVLDAPKVQAYESTPKFFRRDSRPT